MPKFKLDVDGTINSTKIQTGTINTTGNITVATDTGIFFCLNANCSKYITHNGTDVIIQG